MTDNENKTFNNEATTVLNSASKGIDEPTKVLVDEQTKVLTENDRNYVSAQQRNDITNAMSKPQKQPDEDQGALSDERRIKVMSPSMLVFKRFIRNKLAVIGFIILAAMFLFAFLGPIFSPYDSNQAFQKDEYLEKEFAEYKENTSWNTAYSDKEYSSPVIESTKYCEKDVNEFTYKDETYFLRRTDDDKFMFLSAPVLVAEFKNGEITGSNGNKVSEALSAAFAEAVESEKETITVDNVEYTLKKVADKLIISYYKLYGYDDVGYLTKWIIHPAEESATEAVKEYDFKFAALSAIYNKSGKSFKVGADTFMVGSADRNGYYMIKKGGKDFACVTDYTIQSKYGQFISLDFKNMIHEYIEKKESVFIAVNNEGEDAEFTIERKDFKFTITTATRSRVVDQFAAPTGSHMLGTDKYGMDVMTRLMYGGRVSLMVGFVVIIIEMVIGVVLGGLAGYFSGWVDVVIMRVIELFNCIPFYPMLMIIGAVLDANQVSNKARIYLLMVLLGILSWPGVARIVRGQILSLREQDFMVATEACGIPINRRIFRHLVPNVIPLLIVQATMGLGGLIITEATLGFLGLGVKFPDASWGSIINQASSAHVMTNYWWIWIPAGALILITVLGFNFVGDGLRDAFDPKMKR